MSRGALALTSGYSISSVFYFIDLKNGMATTYRLLIAIEYTLPNLSFMDFQEVICNLSANPDYDMAEFEGRIKYA